MNTGELKQRGGRGAGAGGRRVSWEGEQPGPAAAQGKGVGTEGRGGLRAGCAASVVGGLLSSSCCALQLAINALSAGAGCAGFNKILGPVRSEMRWLTGAWLGLFFLLSRRRGWPLRVCVATITLSVVLAALPEVLLWVGSRPLAPPADAVVSFSVGGMGCEACQAHVARRLEGLAGVAYSSVDFASGQGYAVVAADGWGFDQQEAVRRLAEDGYEISFGGSEVAEGGGKGGRASGGAI